MATVAGRGRLRLTRALVDVFAAFLNIARRIEDTVRTPRRDEHTRVWTCGGYRSLTTSLPYYTNLMPFAARLLLPS